jgi:hypothetical protein
MGKKSGTGSGMNNPDHVSESIENFFGGLKYLNSLMRIRDPEWNNCRIWNPGWKKVGSGIRNGKKSDPGSGINIPDPQHCPKLSLATRTSLS